MNLYQINAEILALVDQETGEITDWEAFDALQLAREEKLENLTAERNALRQEEVNLAARRKVVENRVEGLKRYLENALQGEKFKTAKCVVSFRKSTKVALTEPALAIAWAMTHGHSDIVKQVAPEISKDGLAPLLKEGNEIPGAELVTSLSMGVK